MISILLFLLGIYLATRLVAALYGIIDLGYDFKKYYARIIGRILFWAMLISLIALPISLSQRQAFVAGAGFFLIFHIAVFWAGRLIIHRISGTSGEDSDH